MIARCSVPILFVLAGLAACRGEDPPPSASSSAGTRGASTGPAAPPAPLDAAACAKTVAELARRAGVQVDLDAAAHRPTYRWSVEYDAATARLTGSETWRWVNDGGALDLLEFEARAIGPGAGVAPRVTRILIDGVPSAGPPADSLVYKLSHHVEPGRLIEVTFEFAWDLPTPATAPPALETDGIAGLASALGLARSLDPAAVEGQRDGLAILGGMPLRWTDPRGATFHLETTVQTSGDYRATATGVDVGRERAGAGRAAHFVAVDAHGAALVLGRGWAEREVQVGRVGLVVWTLPASAPTPTAGIHEDLALSRVRRALETLAEAWGPCPEPRITVVEMAGPVAGAASLPGIVLVTWPPPSPAPPAGADGLAVVGDVLAHHPARGETLSFALAQAAAQQWWHGRGANGATQNLLAFGLGTAGALRVVGAADGDKARRRAIEIGLHVPFVLQHGSGSGEPTLDTVSVARGDEVAQWKAGFWAERFERQLGESAFADAARALLASKTPIDRSTLEAAFIARAARPDDARAFMRRWLDEAHASEDVGPLDAGVLMEYFVVDGAVGGLENEVLRGPLGAKLLSSLGQGKGLDPSLAIDAIEGLTGTPSNPALKTAMDVGRLVLGHDPEAKKSIADQLVEEVGKDLGISPTERARLKTMTGLALDALETQSGLDHGNATVPDRPLPREVRPP